MKRRKTAYVKGVGAVPTHSIFPASARGKYRTGGNYGRYDGKNMEMKFIDNNMLARVLPTGGEHRPTSITPDLTTPAVAIVGTGTLVQIAQGDQSYQRVGKKIVVKRISARLTVELPGNVAVASSRDVYRVMLFVDTQCNGASPGVAEVLGFPGQALTQHSFNNLENVQRFRVLADVIRPIQPAAGGVAGATGSTGSVTHLLKINKRVNIPIEYSTTATTGAIATIKSNNILMIGISRNGLVTLEGMVRIRYTDY